MKSEAQFLPVHAPSDDRETELMRRALALAAGGCGLVSPGPLVGCVVLDPHGKIAGEGFYVYDGVKHAETLALETAGESARGGTAIVTLEPHAHTGRTPPCTDALIRSGIRRVIAPIEDPNPLVSGRGFAHLRESGIEVVAGTLAREASLLNEKYIHALRARQPFVHLKLASSLDGRIATQTGDSRWITGEAARTRVHEMRHEYDAILVGAGTVMKDDPLLTDRSQMRRRRPLVRVVLDEHLELSVDSKLVQSADQASVLVFASETASLERISALESHGVQVERNESGGRVVSEVLNKLYAKGLHSVLVEGGARVATRFLESKAVNKVSFFIAPRLLGGDTRFSVGGTNPLTVDEAVRLRDVTLRSHGDDVEITGYLKSVYEAST